MSYFPILLTELSRNTISNISSTNSDLNQLYLRNNIFDSNRVINSATKSEVMNLYLLKDSEHSKKRKLVLLQITKSGGPSRSVILKNKGEKTETIESKTNNPS